jgi:hypothetical protein
MTTAANPARADMFAELEAQLDVQQIDWNPEQPGERVVGLVKSIEYLPTKSGGLMGVLRLATPSGAEARVSAGAKNLRAQLEAAKVQPGDGLALQYEGQRQSRTGGNPYNAYRVAMQAVGPRDPGKAFKVPEEADDLGLLPGAAQDPWTVGKATPDTDEVPF